MPLLRSRIAVHNPWVELADGEVMPDDGDIVLSRERLIEEAERVSGRKGRTGVKLAPHDELDDLAGLVGDLDLVILEFPAFTDGRAYSQARRLRMQHGFRGELRATGNILPDQVGLMEQCGFDAFEIDEKYLDDGCFQIADAVSLTYQRGYGLRGRYGKTAQPWTVPETASGFG